MLNDLQETMIDQNTVGYSDLSALFINCTLKRSPVGRRLPLRLPEPRVPLT